MVPLPSLFFIGKNGTPIEVITGLTATSNDLEQKIRSVIERTGKEKRNELLTQSSSNFSSLPAPTPSSSSTPAASASLIATEQAAASTSTSTPTPQSSSADPDIVCKDGVCYRKTDEEKQAEKEELTTDQKVERAKELIEKKKKEKENEDAEAQRERELKRRKEGQDVLNLKKWQEEQEIKQVKDERKREKLEEQANRKRVLDQIAQDKAERAQKFGHLVSPPSPPADPQPGTSKATTPKSENSEFTRIQFKKPNGETDMHTFNSTDTFQTLRNYVKDTILAGTGVRQFTLATTFPRREFTDTDNDSSLNNLGLSPTAVLLIIVKFKSATSSNAVVSTTRGLFDVASTIIWNIFTPLIAIFGYVRNIIFNRGEQGPGAGGNGRATDAASIGAQKRAGEERVSDNDA